MERGSVIDAQIELSEQSYIEYLKCRANYSYYFTNYVRINGRVPEEFEISRIRRFLDLDYGLRISFYDTLNKREDLIKGDELRLRVVK